MHHEILEFKQINTRLRSTISEDGFFRTILLVDKRWGYGSHKLNIAQNFVKQITHF